MKYRVIIEPPAGAEMEKAFRWIAERAPQSAGKWFDGLETAIQTLDTFPERCPLAQRLRQEMLVTLAWIAGRLQIGSVANLKQPAVSAAEGQAQVGDNRT